MKKKSLSLIVVFFLIVILFMLTGCDNVHQSTDKEQELTTSEDNKQKEENQSNKNIEVKEKLIKILNNEEKFVPDKHLSENGEEVYLKDFNMYGDRSEIEEYTYVDLDQDGTVELLCLTKSHAGFYIVFHYENEKIYGYAVSIKEIAKVKTDGTHYGTGGYATYGYSKMMFNKQEYSEVDFAYRCEDEYTIDGKDVSKTEFEEFEKKQNEKEDVKWKKFNNNANSGILDFSNTDEIVYLHSDEGDAYSECTYVLLTIKKDGTIIEDYTYPGATGHGAMSIGTYDYKDNQIIANYEKSSNPESPDEFYDFKQIVVYNIEDGKLYNQETPYYTAVYERK